MIHQVYIMHVTSNWFRYVLFTMTSVCWHGNVWALILEHVDSSYYERLLYRYKTWRSPLGPRHLNQIVLEYTLEIFACTNVPRPSFSNKAPCLIICRYTSYCRLLLRISVITVHTGLTMPLFTVSMVLQRLHRYLETATDVSHNVLLNMNVDARAPTAHGMPHLYDPFFVKKIEGSTHSMLMGYRVPGRTSCVLCIMLLLCL